MKKKIQNTIFKMKYKSQQRKSNTTKCVYSTLFVHNNTIMEVYIATLWRYIYMNVGPS